MPNNLGIGLVSWKKNEVFDLIMHSTHYLLLYGVLMMEIKGVLKSSSINALLT